MSTDRLAQANGKPSALGRVRRPLGLMCADCSTRTPQAQSPLATQTCSGSFG